MIAALAPVALSLVAPQPARVQPMQRAADVQMSVPKAAQVATLAAAAVLAGAQSASAGPFTRSDIASLTYDQIKGTGLANTCPVVEKGAGTSIKLAGGKTYKIDEFCLEPTSFQAGSFFRSLFVCVCGHASAEARFGFGMGRGVDASAGWHDTCALSARRFSSPQRRHLMRCPFTLGAVKQGGKRLACVCVCSGGGGWGAGRGSFCVGFGVGEGGGVRR